MSNSALQRMREDRGYTQVALAKKMDIPLSTYYEWEHKGRAPGFPYRQRLAQALSLTLAEVNTLFRKNAVPATTTIKSEITTIQEYVMSHLCMRLFSIIDAYTYRDQRERFMLIMEEFNTVDAITRLEAVTQLALFPFMMPPLSLATRRETIPASSYEVFLKTCGAGLAACEELLFIGGGKECRIAFESASRYLVELDEIIKNSSQYRTRALELAAIAAILKTDFSHPVQGSLASVAIAQDAVKRCENTGDVCWTLSGKNKMAWAYFLTDQREHALSTARDAAMQMDACKENLPLNIRGGILSTLAIAQARNEIDPAVSLEKAQEFFSPESAYLLNYREENMWLESGNALSHTEDTDGAMRIYEQMIDPQTLQFRPSFAGAAEGYRVQILEGMTRSAIMGSGRDKEKALYYWQSTIDGAKQLESASKHKRALALYDLMKAAFPGERPIRGLRDYFKQ